MPAKVKLPTGKFSRKQYSKVLSRCIRVRNAPERLRLVGELNRLWNLQRRAT